MLTATLNQRRPNATVTSNELLPAGVAVTLSLLLVTLWVVMHRYAGMDHDARVYAFQALSKLHPYLQSDLYLQNTSQDQFTIFSPFYAFFIARMGLENSALLLTVIFTFWYLTAAGAIARQLGKHDLAWFSVVVIIGTSGDYGAFGVFHFPETYLSARLPAYALVATAIALHLGGYARTSLFTGALALFIHPIMALPGALMLLCLSVPLRVSILGAIAGTLGILALAGTAATLPPVARHIAVMDSAWLEVVRERSEFLFLQLWPTKDLVFNARPFLSLALTAAALPGTRERRLTVGALLIGATGLVVALIGGTIGPIALLVQGQAWRWEWLTCFLAMLLLPQTVARMWNDDKCGPICSILLICAWTFPFLDGTVCTLLALMLWHIRGHLSPLTGRHLRWAALAFACVVLTWTAATCWNLMVSTPPESGRESIVLTKLRNVLGLGISALMLFWLVWYWTTRCRSALPLFAFSALLIAGLSYAVPKSLAQIETLDSAAYLAEFADWRSTIPDTSTVFVAPAQDAGKFVWFALQRPHYLSPDQSAGVVFSRATALEVKRRSDVLIPVEAPNWKFLSTRALKAEAKSTLTPPKALTLPQLTAVCSDPLLGYVMARDIAGVEPLRRKDHGKWRGWNLYDCRSLRVLAAGSL